MTESEAFELGNKLYANITSNANNIIKTDGYIEFVGIAIKSIEKQIPKKIKVVEDIRLDGVKEYFAVCTNCDNGTRFCVGIGNYSKRSLKNWTGNCYCSTCGQKLDWSDEE